MSGLEPWYRRRAGAGLLLLVFALAALAAPLWYFRNSDHPMSGQDTVALCERLGGLQPPDAVWSHAPGTSPGLPRLPGTDSEAAGYCVWRDAQGQVAFEAVLSTNRSTRPLGVGALYDRMRSEVVANRTDELREAGAPGERSLRYRRGNSRELLIEDHGILLWLRGYRTEDAWFDQAARTALMQLRKPADQSDIFISASSTAASSRRM